MRFLGLAAAAAFTMGASVATAAPVITILGDDATAYSQVNISNGTSLAGMSFSPDASVLTTSGSIDSSWRSPYDLSGAGWESLEYFSVGPSTAEPATLTLASAKTMLTLLWGSLDTYNSLELFLGTTSQGTISGSDIIALSSSTPGGGGASLVQITGVSFDSVVFTSNGSNAFEFANVAAVPLPAGGLLLLGGLAGLAALRRRKHAA